MRAAAADQGDSLHFLTMFGSRQHEDPPDRPIVKPGDSHTAVWICGQRAALRVCRRKVQKLG